MKMKILAVILIMCLPLMACAGFCAKYKANKDYITTAQTALTTADGFYDYLVAQKQVPDNTKEATLALSAIDEAVPIMKAILDGVCKDDAKVNAADFVITAAKAIAKKYGWKESSTK